MDIDKADPLTKSLILEAREELIFSKSWAADGVKAYVADKEGNIKEKIPEFSSLFPTEWGVNIVEQIDAGFPEKTSAASPKYLTVQQYNDRVYLKYPSSTSASKSFRTIETTGHLGGRTEQLTSIYTYGLIPENPINTRTCNIGYTNEDTGRSIVYKMRLKNQESLRLDNISPNITLGIRASSYNLTGEFDFMTFSGWEYTGRV